MQCGNRLAIKDLPLQPPAEMDALLLGNLRQRLRQNGTQEKIGAQWIDRSLRKIGARR